MKMDVFIHGNPSSHEIWGKDGTDNVYFLNRFYSGMLQEKQYKSIKLLFFISLQNVNGTNYCSYTYLRNNTIDYGGRTGGYFAITFLMEGDCVQPVMRLYSIFRLVYETYVLDNILDSNGDKYNVQSFHRSERINLAIRERIKEEFSCNYSDRDLRKVPVSYKSNGLTKLCNSFDCDEGRSISLDSILKEFYSGSEVVISPEFPSLAIRDIQMKYENKISQINKEHNEEKKTIIDNKQKEIEQVKGVLQEEQSKNSQLKNEKSLLDKEKKQFLEENKRLENEKEGYKNKFESVRSKYSVELVNYLNKEIKDIIWRIRDTISSGGEMTPSGVETNRNFLRRHLFHVIQYILLAIITLSCIFLVCNSLGVFKNKKDAEANNTDNTEIIKLQAEKKGLESRVNELENDNINLQKEKEALEKQLTEKNDLKQQPPVASTPKPPRIDIKNFSRNDSFVVGKTYEIRILNLTETKGGKWEVENADVKQNGEKNCKIKIRDGEKVDIKYLQDGNVILSRSVDISKNNSDK